MGVRNSRMMGLPPFVLGALILESSASTLARTPSAWMDPSWLLSIPGTVFGLAATLLGVVIVLGLEDSVLGSRDS